MSEDGQGMRLHVDIGAGWSFRKGRVNRTWLSDAGSAGCADATVHLPHCWNTTDTFREGVEYYRGPGAYRRSVRAHELPQPPVASRLFLESGGFYGTGSVLVDGRVLGHVDGQYLGFSLDVTEVLRGNGEHVIGIRLTNRCPLHVLPGHRMPDFLLYGGLSGAVALVTRPCVRVDRNKTRIIPRRDASGTPILRIDAELVNEDAAVRVVDMEWRVVADRGGAAREGAVRGLRLAGNGARMAGGVDLPVDGMPSWSPWEPNLLRVEGSLREDGRTVDVVSWRVGWREAAFKPRQGFFVNGRRCALRGCNRHESMPGFGRALPEAFHREDARQIRELGLNFVRLSHYPQHPSFLEACDELGILVLAEIASWKSVRRGRWLKAAQRQLAGMIERDRNHPAIVAWGMGNEGRDRHAFLQLRKTARQLDPDRVVTYAENHWYRARRKRTLGIPDVWGLNYELDAIERGCASARLQTVVVTEAANEPLTERGNLEAELRQAATIEKVLESLDDRPCVAGFALWCFNDYATLRKRRYRRFSGLVDAWRRPKAAAAMLRARYATDPFLKLVGDWSSSGPLRRTIHVFTNCESICFMREGKELVRMAGGTHLVHEFPFQPFVLTARGFCRDLAVEDRLHPFGVASAVRVDPQRALAGGHIRAAVVRVVDSAGVTVRNWNGVVRMALSGPGVLRGNREDGGIDVYGGSGRVFFEMAEGNEPVRLEATCRGLSPAAAEVYA